MTFLKTILVLLGLHDGLQPSDVFIQTFSMVVLLILMIPYSAYLYFFLSSAAGKVAKDEKHLAAVEEVGVL